MQEIFWIVWVPTSERTPTFRHELRANAIKEAERLARNNPDTEVFVLQATHRSINQTVHTEALYAPDGVTVPTLRRDTIDSLPF
jgi:hypothetical protein